MKIDKKASIAGGIVGGIIALSQGALSNLGFSLLERIIVSVILGVVLGLTVMFVLGR